MAALVQSPFCTSKYISYSSTPFLHFSKGMKVNLETNKGNRVKGGNTNSWLRITCVEGKNRQIRKMLDHLGLKVTRLIRISFGDYSLNTIPPGMAIEVPVKPLETQRRKGGFDPTRRPRAKRGNAREERGGGQEKAAPVEWIRHQ